MTREDAIAALVSLTEVQRISVASLKPTDVIVVNVSQFILPEAATRIGETIKRVWPDNKVIVLEKGVELRVADGASIGADVPGGGAV